MKNQRPPSQLSQVLLLSAVWTLATTTIPVAAMPAETKNTMRAEMGFKDKTSTTTTTTTPSPVTGEGVTAGEEVIQTSTRKPYNCSESHRPHRNDSNKFQVRHNKVWWDQVCQTGLIWNQTLCRCEYQWDLDGDYPKVTCPDYREHGNLSGKFEQKVNGDWVIRDCNLAVAGLVWNQTVCRCVWGPDGDISQLDFERSTPCDTMLNVTFEDGLVDEAKSSFLELASGSSVDVRNYKGKEGQGNKAAYFEDSTMNVWYFAGNEMSGSLRVELRFKAEDSAITRDRYQILLSNGCNVTGLGYTTPSVAIGYRASDKSFLLALHTANVRKAIVCTRDLEPFAWHQVSLIYEDGTLLFRVDNHPCIISNDFTGDVQKTPCPLTIGSDPLEKESKYIGYMDDVMVARYCRRFVEQTLVPELHKEQGKVVEVAAEDPKVPAEDSHPPDSKQADSKDESKDKIQTYRALI